MRARGAVVMGVVALALLRPTPGTPSTPDAATGADAYRHLVTYADLGVHRTGTRVDAKTSRWVGNELAALGYRVEHQAFAFPRFLTGEVSLRVGDARPPVMPFYYSGSTGTRGVRAPLVDVGYGTPPEFAMADAAGKVVLVEVPQPAPGAHPSFERAVAAARDAGAAAVVAAVGAPGNQLFGVNSDSRRGLCDLPVVIVGRHDGAALRGLAGQEATLVLNAAVRTATTRNVVAVLPGRSDRVVIVGTPMNGWFRAATERGTGVGTFLTLARHFAGSRPEHTLVFVATAGHEVGFLGLERFLADNPDLVRRAVAYVHLGASLAARHETEVGGRTHATGLPDPLRVLIVSENPVLEAIARPAFLPAQPMQTVPPASGQSGEQQYAYEAGVPIVSISGTFLWFHTPRDLRDTTSAALLDPVVGAFRSAIEQLLAVDPDLVDAGNAAARSVNQVASEGMGNTAAAC